MNIAYIFHGHSRTWNHCYNQFFENVFSVCPGDIFIHTWDRVNSTAGSHWNGWAEDIIIEKDKGIQHHKKNLPHISLPHLGVKNMLDSCLKVFNMAKNHKKYDKFFSTRMDIRYLTKFDKNELYKLY